MSEELPDGWSLSALGDLISGFEAGRNLRSEGRPARENEYGVLKISAVTWGAFQPSENKALLPDDEPKPHERIRKNDLLVTRANTSELVGAVVLVDRDHPNLMLPDKILRLCPKAGLIDPGFLLYALRTPAVREHFESNATGTSESMRNLSQPKLAAAPVPLAPLPEQRRIFATVEALMSEVSATRARLAKVSLILKRFRQSVLSAACSGLLTEQWRQQNRDVAWSNVEFARVLKQAKKKAGTDAEMVPDFDLPTGWRGTTLDRLTSFVTSGSRGWAEYYAEDGPLFIRAQDIKHDVLALDGIAHVRPPDGAEGTRTRAQQHDLLITITGANVTKAALVRRPLNEAYVSQHVALVRPEATEMSEWLYLWTIAPAQGRKQLLDLAYGAGKPGLNLENIRSMMVGLPPLKEQAEIVRRVEALFALADSIEHRVAVAIARTDKLPQAILAKAFRGELVPTEAELARAEGRDYEPASALLERIRNEREAAGPTAARGRRKAAPEKASGKTKRAAAR